MSKSNNLGDFLISIANSIRNKKGTTAQISAQDFDIEIASISTTTPTLNAPTVALSGSTLTITNPATNGNFVVGYKVFSGSTLIATVQTTTVDLLTYLTTTGTYTITATAYGTNFTDSGASNSVSYTEAPSAWVYGVSGLGNSSPILTRTYDNVGKTYAISSSSGTITTDFDTIFNFDTVVQNGNTMIKIPTMYKRVDATSSNQITAFSMSNAQVDASFIPYPCFVDENGNTLDYILISKGKATGTSSKASCVSGSFPLVSVTRAQLRTAARANGTGWEQYNYPYVQLIRDLFCVVFATTNSQSIFLGRTTGFSSSATVGSTWNMSTPCGWNLTTMQNRFFGIEDIFGNVYDWCDGVVFSSSSCYITNSPSLFSDTTTGMLSAGTRPTTGSYTSKLNYNTSYPIFNYSSANSGSETTYYCDYNSYNASGTVLCVGGYWDNAFVAGLWYAGGYGTATYANANIGGRLVYRPISE